MLEYYCSQSFPERLGSAERVVPVPSFPFPLYRGTGNDGNDSLIGLIQEQFLMVIKLSFNARRRWRSVARWATCAAVAFALAAVAALALGSIGAGSYAMAIIGAMIGGAAGAVAILWDVADAIEDII